ncbi:MAG: GNAT family N-acetyltransferase [Myxococcota bacterium]
MPIEIVEAEPGNPVHDLGVVEILDAYAREPAGGGRPLSDEVRSRLPAELRALPDAYVWLALEGPDPVGVAICFRGFSTFSARPLLNLHDLAVLPSHRGRGIGTRLLQTLEARARDLGCCKLTLEVRGDNPRAHALYARMGFSDFAPGGGSVPTRFLQKQL